MSSSLFKRIVFIMSATPPCRCPQRRKDPLPSHGNPRSTFLWLIQVHSFDLVPQRRSPSTKKAVSIWNEISLIFKLFRVPSTVRLPFHHRNDSLSYSFTCYQELDIVSIDGRYEGLGEDGYVQEQTNGDLPSALMSFLLFPIRNIHPQHLLPTSDLRPILLSESLSPWFFPHSQHAIDFPLSR